MTNNAIIGALLMGPLLYVGIGMLVVCLVSLPGGDQSYYIRSDKEGVACVLLWPFVIGAILLALVWSLCRFIGRRFLFSKLE